MDAQRAEVCALEAEIAALRRACEEPRAAGEDAGLVQKSLREIYPSDSEGWASSKDLQSHLEHLESELLFLSTLTGINIRNYSMKTEDLTSTEKTEKSIKKVLQKHRLSGNCHMITFQLEFEILEIQNKESLSSVITDLNIIMEPTEYSELSEFVSRAEERRDLLMFFRSLRFFVEWCDYRKRTFQHLKAHYFLFILVFNFITGQVPGSRAPPRGGRVQLHGGPERLPARVRAGRRLEDAHGGRREGFSEAGSSPQSATASPGARPAPHPGDCAPPLQNPAGCAGHRSCSRKPDNISVPSRQPVSGKHAGV
ncbi:centromere protein P isoform X2 [Canis lupus familiaris]|uniref:centromere protein P isoform X2 n=1 Tax=Canis lupus familiaris TaxID=9615 RepID=UPI000BAA1491|nr:centromere protein P isoform X2 [Canis lupus familiaris]XP_025279472.1 centromere protein P isoform X2 [Canis lupus dingo]XP_038511433.1 centromere protein P isoform X2 [Canis lupus familiaris]|eukprot:XP_022278123.1 centromere protein P isoform X2 [Canis lupus familiaris]